jgi:hypothetical protein
MKVFVVPTPLTGRITPMALIGYSTLSGGYQVTSYRLTSYYL